MDRVDREHYERMLTLTAYPEWEEWIGELKKELYQEQSDVLELCDTWDKVNVKRGRAQRIAEVINFRDVVKAVLDNEL